MFRSVYLKLTILYVAVIMAISLFFSIIYYQSSVRDLNAGFQRQSDALHRSQTGMMFFQQSDFQTVITQQLDESRDHVFWELIYVNFIILIGGAAASYALALYSLKPVQDSMEEQARFTADASHELRTPLTAMRTETEVLLRDKKVSIDEMRSQLESNLEEVGKLERLSSALLTLARHEHAAEMAFEPVPVQDIWEDAQKRLVAKITQHKAVITVSANELSVRGQKDMLVELIVILLDNALKYSKPESEIDLSARHDGHSVVLTVRDHGFGIHASDIPHIFDRFYRVDRARSQSVDGYGLGLSIAHQIVQQHSGKIEVTSEPGKGTCFTIKLPKAA